ncbi:unannotated protein [freshwater metagenome]|uniref:Unannotated protein n=1 Tax=freshwater metagenome TaxID=449393 RepID=A0A6J6LGE2_9ZZZZ
MYEAPVALVTAVWRFQPPLPALPPSYANVIFEPAWLTRDDKRPVAGSTYEDLETFSATAFTTFGSFTFVVVM